MLESYMNQTYIYCAHCQQAAPGDAHDVPEERVRYLRGAKEVPIAYWVML